MAYSDPWEYNSYDGLGFSNAAQASAWQSAAAAPAVNYASSGSYNWGNLTQGLLGVADTYLKTDAAVRMQQNQYGQRYLEGQALSYSNASGLTVPPGLLLIGGLVAFVMLAKD